MFRHLAIALSISLSLGVSNAQGVSQQRGQQVQSAVDRMMADPELSRLLNDPNLLNRIAQEAAQEMPTRQSQMRQMDAGCRQGFAGIVDLFVGDPHHPQGTPPFTKSAVTGNPRPTWNVHAVPAGQARGWMLRFHYREIIDYVDGEPVYREWFEYESVVVLSPRSEDVGRRGAILALATDGEHHAVIDTQGRPHYKTYMRHRVGRQGEMAQPFKKGNLQSRYVWRLDYGTQLPSQNGEVFLGYGMIDPRASELQAINARARETVLPRQLAALDMQSEIAGENPDMARRVMDMTCGARQGQGINEDADLARMRAENADMLRSLCQNPADASMAQMCARAAALQQRAQTQGAQRAQQAQRQRTEPRGQPRQAQGMRDVCQRRDFAGMIILQKEDARIAALDLEEKARVGFWEIRSAYESGLQRQTCWSVLLWNQPSIAPDNGGGN